MDGTDFSSEDFAHRFVVPAFRRENDQYFLNNRMVIVGDEIMGLIDYLNDLLLKKYGSPEATPFRFEEGMRVTGLYPGRYETDPIYSKIMIRHLPKNFNAANWDANIADSRLQRANGTVHIHEIMEILEPEVVHESNPTLAKLRLLNCEITFA